MNAVLILGLLACNEGGADNGGGGGTGDGGTEDDDGFPSGTCRSVPGIAGAPAMLAEAVCAPLHDCTCPEAEDASKEACVSVRTAAYEDAFADAMANGLDYHGDCLGLLVAFAQALGCTGEIDNDLICTDVLCSPLAGTKQIGEPCNEWEYQDFTFDDCSPELSCHSECGCKPNLDLGELGEPCGECYTFCEAGLVCITGPEDEHGTCQLSDAGREGDPCTSDFDCGLDLQCLADVCAARGEAGDPCEEDGDCDHMLYCPAGTCAERLPAGSACTHQGECMGYCHDDGICVSALCGIQALDGG